MCLRAANHARAAPKPQAELYVAFLEATLVMLEGREGEGDETPPVYRLEIPDLWRVPDAMAHIRALLGRHPEGGDLALFLPPLPAEAPNGPLKARAMLASTLVAGLELVRDGTLDVAQAESFGPIQLQALANESDVRR